MANENTLVNQKKKKLPHIYGLLFIIIIVCTIATWILPAGEFDRADVGGRSVAVAGTYHAVEASPVNPFQMFQAIYNGFCDAGGVIFFVFISYASISIIIGSGAFNGLVAALLKIFKGKARVVIIPVFLTIIGLASSTIGRGDGLRRRCRSGHCGCRRGYGLFGSYDESLYRRCGPGHR